MNQKLVNYQELIRAVESIFLSIGVRSDVACAFSEGICQNSLRGIDSHGIRLLPHYITALEGGRINKNPQYRFFQNASANGLFDADHGPGHAAGAEAMGKAIKIAESQGVGAVAVFNSTHFGAAGFYALKAAEVDMIGLSFTNATAHVLPFKGSRPFLGNNPICMCAPVEGEEPFCLDMATTPGTFNGVQRLKEMGRPLPAGWCADEKGAETTDALKAVHLLPIGGYKGFGLSMMVEILCSVISGMPYGPNVTHMFGTKMDEKRYLGHFFVVLNIASFTDLTTFKSRMKEMMTALRAEESSDPLLPVMCPGDPEKKAKADRLVNGIPITIPVFNEINGRLAQYGLPALESF